MCEEKPKPSAPQLPDVTIIVKEFGMFDELEPNKILFTPTTSIPFVVGQAYGWRFKVTTKKKSVIVRQDYEAPEPLKGPAEEGETISKDRKVCTTTDELNVRGGYIFTAWSVAKDDPEGEYKARIYIDDKLQAEFKFTVKH